MGKFTSALDMMFKIAYNDYNCTAKLFQTPEDFADYDRVHEYEQNLLYPHHWDRGPNAPRGPLAAPLTQAQRRRMGDTACEVLIIVSTKLACSANPDLLCSSLRRLSTEELITYYVDMKLGQKVPSWFISAFKSTVDRDKYGAMIIDLDLLDNMAYDTLEAGDYTVGPLCEQWLSALERVGVQDAAGLTMNDLRYAKGLT